MTNSWAKVLVALLKYVLGPVVAALIGLYAGTYSTDAAKTGYRVLAQNYNDQVLSKLLELDGRLDQLEKKIGQVAAAASQPAVVVAPASVPVRRHGVVAVAGFKGPVVAKAPPTPAVPHHAPKPAPRMKLYKIPADLGSLK